MYSSFENELKGENSASTIEVNEMHSVEGKSEQGDTKKPEKNYFNKWVLDADFSKVKINNSLFCEGDLNLPVLENFANKF